MIGLFPHIFVILGKPLYWPDHSKQLSILLEATDKNISQLLTSFLLEELFHEMCG